MKHLSQDESIRRLMAAPTDEELRAFVAAASSSDYDFKDFDIRVYNRCVFGHVHHLRGGESWQIDRPGMGDLIAANIMKTANTRLVRLIAIERVPGISAYRNAEGRSKDFARREDVARTFKLHDAIAAVNRYFDPHIDETLIWPWASRGYRNIHMWAAS